MAATLISIQTGRTAPLGPEGVPSGFVKRPRRGAVSIGLLGLDGDEQADLSVHGGPEKAVYGYAVSHYPAWQAEFPEHTALFAPGSVGENLAIGGMDETAICVGDLHAIGTAVLQVCQPRQPCFKFALRFQDIRLPGAMVRSGRAGWYYRVITPGVIAANDPVIVQDRPNPDFPFARLVAIVNHKRASVTELHRMATMTGIASQWQAWAEKALQKLASGPQGLS